MLAPQVHPYALFFAALAKSRSCRRLELDCPDIQMKQPYLVEWKTLKPFFNAVVGSVCNPAIMLTSIPPHRSIFFAWAD
jgi:hypothetical protein